MRAEGTEVIPAWSVASSCPILLKLEQGLGVGVRSVGAPVRRLWGLAPSEGAARGVGAFGRGGGWRQDGLGVGHFLHLRQELWFRLDSTNYTEIVSAILKGHSGILQHSLMLIMSAGC